MNLQLEDYNGLHLVLHGKSLRPDMAAVVTSRLFDSRLRLETIELGATFVPLPTTGPELLAAALRTVLRDPHDTAPIVAPFERRISERRTIHAPQPIAFPDRRRVERRQGLARLLHAPGTEG